jgi:hypothetical protein
MARTLVAPIAPDFRLDWEDADVTWKMAGNVEAGFGPWTDSDVASNIRLRLNHAHAFGFGESIGFKSPLLALDTERALFSALMAQGFEVTTVLVQRERAALERSIDRQRGAAVMRRWNGMIQRVGYIRHGLLVPYEALVAEPEVRVAGLAEALGVRDAASIARATARVAAPCS